MPQLDSFSTRTLPPKERHRTWNARLKKAYGFEDVSVTTEGCAADFDAGITALYEGGVMVGRMSASAQRVELGARAGANAKDPLIHVFFPAQGHWRIEQFGRSAAFGTGDWGFFDTTEAFACTHDAPLELLVVGAPRSVIFGSDIHPERYAAQRFSAEHGSACIARNYLSALLAQRGALNPLTSAELAAVAVRLVRLSILENLRARSELKMRAMLRLLIRDFVDQNLRNSELSVEMVAAAHRCSKRYVHKVFSTDGETLSHYILRARLEHCRRDLLKPEAAHLSVTQIAFSWGFNSPGHFSRVFRQQFGMAPSDCRDRPALAPSPIAAALGSSAAKFSFPGGQAA